VRVFGRIRGEQEDRDVDVKLSDAKTDNRHWATQPDQQLAYHGARVWARRHMPELMLGVYSPEEMPSLPTGKPVVTLTPSSLPQPSPEEETDEEKISRWTKDIKAAESMNVLREVGKAIKRENISDVVRKELSEAYAVRQGELIKKQPSEPPKLAVKVEQPDGSMAPLDDVPPESHWDSAERVPGGDDE
jgi:hypothetical protein